MNQASPYQIHRLLTLVDEGYSIAAAGRDVGLHRDTVRTWVRQWGNAKAYREATGFVPTAAPPPPVPAMIVPPTQFDTSEYILTRDGTPIHDRRVYLATAAQNNTAIHEGFWQNLQAYARYRQAEVLVGGFIYRKDALGQAGQEKDHDATEERRDEWDLRLAAYRADERRHIGPGLVWMGQMNALPTNTDPLAGLSGFSRGDSAIYPHVKVAMRSIATAPGTDPKFVYTTGAVTVPNYIQRKSGQVAEFHHIIGAMIVEVEGDNWFARQINATDDGSFQDLDVIVKDGRVTSGHSVFAINWGDVHEAKLTRATEEAMIEILGDMRPQYQFFHDLVDAESANPHSADDHLQRYKLVQDGLDDVRAELDRVSALLTRLDRPGTVSVVVPSNHDDMIVRWLKRIDHKRDPRNMRFYHEASLAALDMIDRNEGVDLIKWHLGRANPNVLFIPPNRPTFVLKGIEFGQHGHNGPHGNRRANAKSYTVLAIKVNKGHEHIASIYDAVFTAGAMELDHKYNVGYSAWSRTLTFTYPNGKRAQITMRGQQYRGATR